MKGKTVVLDAGHGGSDTGAAWRGRLEKDDTLLLARQTGRQLERLGYFVSYTRPEDQFLPLDRRLEHARAAGGDALVSLHRNSYKPQVARGFAVYVALHPTEGDLRLAQSIYRRVLEALPVMPRGVSSYDYYLCRTAPRPACLVEALFLDHSEDNCLFDSQLPVLASAIAQGIADALAED